MSNLTTLPKGDSAWLLRKSIQRIMQQVSVLETNIGSSTTGNSSDTQIIFNDAGTLRGDSGLTYNKTTDLLSVGAATITGDLTVRTNKLQVTSTGVGIGGASAAYPLEINGGASASTSQFKSSSASVITRFTDGTGETGYVGSGTSLISGISRTDFGIASNGALVFGVSTGLAMTLNSTGLGVGVTPSTGKFEVGIGAGTTTPFFRFLGNSGTWNGQFNFDASGNLQAYAYNGTKFTDFIWTYGNVGIGVTPSAWTGGRAVDLQLYGNLNTWDDGTAAQIQAGFNFYQTGSTFKYKISSLASMYRQRLGVHSWHTAPSGTADAAITWTQAMTLDASGILAIGTVALGFTSSKSTYFSPVAGYWIGNHTTGTPSGDRYWGFGYGVNEVGSITQNGTTGVLYNITSDYRLKEQVQPLIGGLARVNALKPSVYKWKSDGSNGEGFLAHELAEVVPFAVTGEKDAVNEDGSIKSQGIDMSRVVPILVAAIQELAAEVNALKNA